MKIEVDTVVKNAKNCHETGGQSPIMEKRPPESQGIDRNVFFGAQATLPKCPELFSEKTCLAAKWLILIYMQFIVFLKKVRRCRGCRGQSHMQTLDGHHESDSFHQSTQSTTILGKMHVFCPLQMASIQLLNSFLQWAQEVPSPTSRAGFVHLSQIF